MNLIRNILGRNARTGLPTLSLPLQLSSVNCYHTLFKNMDSIQQPKLDKLKQSSLLAPVSIIAIPVCGFKFRDIVKKRCKDCYIIVKDRQKIVLCKTHRRHKQKENVPAEKDTWIITHRTSGKIRPW